MRSEIREGGPSDVIIVNQDLLIAHLLKRAQTSRGFIANRLPVIIIDEAHNLEEKTRKALTRMWSPKKFKNLFKRVNKLLQSKENYFELLPHIEYIQTMINHMFLEWAADMENRIKEQDRYHYSDRIEVIVPTNLAKSEYKNAFNHLLTSLNIIDGKREREAEEVAGELESLHLFFDDLKQSNNASQIYWGSANIEKGIDSIHIYHAPKDINRKLDTILFRNSDYRVPVVLTSATLCQHAESVEKQYKYQAEALGYSGLYSEPKLSPFAYDENARIYIPSDIIPPTKERHEMYLKQISNKILELALATNGRTMVLFTSKEDLQYVYHKLNDKKLPWPILTQRKGSSQSKVIDEFKSSQGLLLVTGVFWEGINISGQALSQVIIPRLPFPVPDPIVNYKCSMTTNPTNDVLIPEMLVKLRQGVGRLIRSETDKGIVSILDSRVSSHPRKRRDYRDDVLNILPIKTQLYSIEEVREFAKTFNSTTFSLLQSG